MTAIIRPIGSLKSYINNLPEKMVVSGICVRDAINQVGIPPEIVALVLVNESPQDKEYIIKDGDVIKLLAVIGGG